jgi:hypothetical protein
MQDLFKIDFDFLGFRINIHIKTFTNKNEVKEFLNDDNFRGDASFSVIKGEEHSYIFFKEDNYNSPYHYAHELLHATKYYLQQHLGIDDEEAECYFLGYIVGIYTEFLETYKKQQKELHNDTIKRTKTIRKKSPKNNIKK